MYTGEHLLIGQLGKGALILSLCAAGFAALLYFRARQHKKMLVTARVAYLVHTLAVVISCIALMVMIFNHTFEYQYVWQYSSLDLSPTYLFSAFWAGKEGSMLLWLLLQAVLGMALVFRRKTPDSVMGVIAVAQCLLGLLLIGLTIGDFQLGRSPFALLREMPDYASMPLFSNPDYLSFLTDGNGLNPLLRNPWMAIHPPVLFLGYAACLIPYAFSIVSSGTEKIKISVPLFWPVFAAFCLGAGLILGGAWAYEDLTFGGFWSWDPVENASLVPWLLVLASLHFLLNPKYRATGNVFSLAPYITVLFAAYLTRSGVLSTTSVHSFSGGQGSVLLLAYTLLAIVIPLVILVFRKKTQEPLTSENILSPWVWMFIGAAILALSAFQVLFVTSVPALNTWFGLHLAPPSDSVSFYNSWQQWFAAGIALTMGIVLYLPADKSTVKAFVLRALPGFILSLSVMFLLVFLLPALSWSLYVVLFCLLFGGLAMLDGMLRVNGRKSNFAASLTHTGFVIFIIGVVITFSLQKPLGSTDSQNPKGLQTLVLGQIKPLQNGYVSYAGRTVNKDEIRYRIDFLYKAKDGRYYLDYTLYPSITEQADMGPVPKPDTRKRLKEDIFVHLSHAEITKEEYQPVRSGKVAVGDTLAIPAGLLILDSLTEKALIPTDSLSLSIIAWCTFREAGKPALSMNPGLKLMNGKEIHDDVIRDSANIRLSLIYPVSRDTAYLELSARKTDYVVMSARSFPYINLLWLGVIIMAAGMGISLVKRGRFI